MRTIEEVLDYCKKERAQLQKYVDAPAWDEDAWGGASMASAYDNVIDYIEGREGA